MPLAHSDDRAARWAADQNLQSCIKGAILAAGLGRRLDPLTAYQLPKPLFPLGGKVPISEIWVRRFVRSGMPNVSMNLCVMADAMKRHFGDGRRLGADLTSVEEVTPTGTLGGVCKMALGSSAKVLPTDSSPVGFPPFQGTTIIVPSGDIVTNFGCALLGEMYDIHRKSGAAITMVLTEIPRDRRGDFGTVVLSNPQSRPGPISQSGRIQEFREKDPNSPSCLNNASIYMIERELLQLADGYRTEAKVGLEEPFYDFGKHLFPAALGKLPYVRFPRDYVLWGIQYDGPWFDVGTKRDYLSVNRAVLDGEIDVPMEYEQVSWGYRGSNVELGRNVEIVAPVVIGNDCVIENGAKIGPYAVIGDGWRIEAGAEVRNSVLWERYPYFDGSREISVAERMLADAHRIGSDVRIEESIVAGGTITEDVIAKTVDVRDSGYTAILPIDYTPAEARA